MESREPSASAVYTAKNRCLPRLEPVSVNVFALPSTHFGRKDHVLQFCLARSSLVTSSGQQDRRCLGRRKPKRFRDSDENSP